MFCESQIDETTRTAALQNCPGPEGNVLQTTWLMVTKGFVSGKQPIVIRRSINIPIDLINENNKQCDTHTHTLTHTHIYNYI